MDARELLQQVIAGAVAEDNEATSDAFKAYTILKMKSMMALQPEDVDIPDSE